MSAPAAISHQAAINALDDAVALLHAMVQRRRSRQAATTETVAQRRPLGADVWPTMHEAVPAVESNRDGFEEDNRRDQLTTIAD